MQLGFRVIIALIVLALVPVYSSAVIEEKSSVIGTLIDASNTPWKGVTIRLLDSFFLDEVAKTTTDEKGSFVLSSLLPGLYLLSVESDNIPSLLKRVQVISDHPTFIDIQPYLDEEGASKHSAWDKLKWTIRVAERNPLRNEKNTVKRKTDRDFHSEGFLAFFRDLQRKNNIEGELSYLNVGNNPTSSSLSQTQLQVQGEIPGSGEWSFNGNLLDGSRSSYIASGDFNYRFSSHRIGARFAANDLLFSRFPASMDEEHITRFIQSAGSELGDHNKLWITSVDFGDEWQLFRRLRVDYGARIDYYGYLSDSISYSPRLQVAYQLTPAFSLRGVYFRSHSAPGNYYLHSDGIRPYVHNIAFMPYGSDLEPETSIGFGAGIDFSRDGLQMSMSYYNENVANKIATLEISDAPVSEQLGTLLPFVIFNVDDLQKEGFEFQVSKKVLPSVRAVATYNLSQTVPVFIVEKRSFSQRQIYFKKGREAVDYHDLQAGVEASIRGTQTDIEANWKWSSGSPLVFGQKEEQLFAIDLEVRQGLPVSLFSQVQLRLLLAVRNLLDQNSEAKGNADFQRSLLYGMPRVVAGGLLVSF